MKTHLGAFIQNKMKSKEQGKSFLANSIMFKRKTTFFTKLIKEDEEKRFLNDSNDYRKQFEKQKNRDHKIGADIYSIAIVALLNHHEIKITEE